MYVKVVTKRSSNITRYNMIILDNLVGSWKLLHEQCPALNFSKKKELPIVN